MTCEFAHDDAAYLLGALSPSERLAFERHLPGCAECSHAVQELAGLPGLLGRVTRETLEAEPTTVPVPETLLPRLIREARRAQRRRTWATAGLAVAATVIVSTGVAVLTGVPGGGEPSASPPTVSAGPSTSSSAAPSASPSATAAPVRAMVPVTETPMSVDVSMTGVAWGTRLALVCSYASTTGSGSGGGEWGQGGGGEWGEDEEPVYALVVRDREGQVEQVATWRALPGETMHLDAATATSREDIASVEVHTADGKPVLELDG